MKSVHKGLESLSYLDPKICELLPLEIKETENLLQFKDKIRKWNPKNCPCLVYKIYLQNDGFIWVNKQRKHLSFLSWISLSNESLMRNKLLVCLHLPRHSFTEDSGFWSVTIAFICFKLCVYMYINLFVFVFIYLLLG